MAEMDINALIQKLGTQRGGLGEALGVLGAGLLAAGGPTTRMENTNIGPSLLAFQKSLQQNRQNNALRQIQAAQLGLQQRGVAETERRGDIAEGDTELRRKLADIKLRFPNAVFKEVNGRIQARHPRTGDLIKDLGAATPKPGTSVTVINKGEGDASDLALAKEMGKIDARKIGEIGAAGDLGVQQLGRLQVIEQALDNYKQNGGDFGKLSTLNLTASEYVKALGGDPQNFGLVPGDAQPAGQFLQGQFAQGVAARVGTKNGGLPANTFSEKDRELTERSVAGFDNSENGIRAKLFVEKKVAAVAKAKRDRFEDLREENEKTMTQAKAARQAFRQVTKEFRNLDLYTPEERRELTSLLNTHKRKPPGKLENIMKIEDPEKRKEALKRALQQRF